MSIVENIVSFVRDNPGCTRADLLAGVRINDMRNALPSYCRKVGLIFTAGPRGSQRYYPSADAAAAADAAIRAEVIERKARTRRDAQLRDNLRERAQRLAAGAKPVNTRPGRMGVVLDADAKLQDGAKITRAETPRGRFEFAPPAGWVGEITKDWRARRLEECR